MNKEEIDNEHLESLEVFMEHHYIADNGHYQWVKKRFKELQQENKQLKANRDEAIKLIVEDYYSGTTIDINSIGYTTNKMLKVKNILERGKE